MYCYYYYYYDDDDDDAAAAAAAAAAATTTTTTTTTTKTKTTTTTTTAATTFASCTALLNKNDASKPSLRNPKFTATKASLQRSVSDFNFPGCEKASHRRVCSGCHAGYSDHWAPGCKAPRSIRHEFVVEEFCVTKDLAACASQISWTMPTMANRRTVFGPHMQSYNWSVCTCGSVEKLWMLLFLLPFCRWILPSQA